MSDLTERYVLATLRSIPERQRADIEKELRASIDDAVEARLESGDVADVAEKEVLTELGDPDRLAAGYSGRPAYLIGPEHFFVYKRLLTVLLVTVVPIVAVVMAVIQALSGAGVGEVFADTFGLVFNLVVHMVFWTTLVFYLIERSDNADIGEVWSPDQLPAAPSGGQISLSDTIASVVVLVLMITGLLVLRGSSPVVDADGATVALFNTDMWSFWIPFFVVVLGVQVVFEVIKYRRGRWTWGLASVNLALNALFAIPAVWLLASGQLLNPEFFETLGIDVVNADRTGVIAGIVIGLICLYDSVEGFVKARR